MIFILKNKYRKGYTLIEMFVYISILYVVLAMIWSIFFRTSKIVKLNNKYLDAIYAVNEFKDIIQTDIRSALKIIPEKRGFKTSKHTLVLAIPNETATNEDNLNYVIYDFSPEDKILKRVYLKKTQDGLIPATRKIKFKIKELKFVIRDLSNNKIVDVSLITDFINKKTEKNLALDFSVCFRY